MHAYMAMAIANDKVTVEEAKETDSAQTQQNARQNYSIEQQIFPQYESIANIMRQIAKDKYMHYISKGPIRTI